MLPNTPQPRGALALQLAFTLLTLAACSRAPVTTSPAPELPRPLPETPMEGLTPSARSVAFTYGAGSSRYLVESMAVVTLSGDSVPPGVDSVRIAATVVVAISDGDSTRSVAGTIYDSALEEGALIRQPGPVPRSTAPQTLSFVGEIALGKTSLEAALDPADTVGSTGDCDAAATAVSTLVGLAREALPPVPDSVRIGATWHDSVAIPTCRSGVHLVASARHEYQLLELRESGDTTFALVRRSTLHRVDGSGTQSQLPVTVAGLGMGSSDLWLDLTHGRLISHEGQATLAIQHTAGTRIVNMEQKSSVSIRLDGSN